MRRGRYGPWLGSTTHRSTSHRSALDIGCGCGRDAVYLALKGWHVTGIDVSAVNTLPPPVSFMSLTVISFFAPVLVIAFMHLYLFYVFACDVEVEEVSKMMVQKHEVSINMWANYVIIFCRCYDAA